jgi:hypothetical protein
MILSKEAYDSVVFTGKNNVFEYENVVTYSLNGYVKLVGGYEIQLYSSETKLFIEGHKSFISLKYTPDEETTASESDTGSL